MALIKFQTGQVVRFDGDPTPEDVNYVAVKLGLEKPAQQETPQEQKPFTFDVPEIKESRESVRSRVAKEAEQYKKEAQESGSLLGIAKNTIKGAGEMIAAPEIGLGKSLGQIYGDQGAKVGESANALRDTNIQLYKQIKDREATGKDVTNLKRAYNQNAKLIQEMEGEKVRQGALPTDYELAGQIGGTALDVLTAGTATKGMQAGKMTVPKMFTKQGVKAGLSVVEPGIGQAVSNVPKGLYSAQGVKNILKGTGVGYASDVTSGMMGLRGEEYKDEKAFIPGLGTLIGGGLSGAMELDASLAYRKSPQRQWSQRTKELNKIINDNSDLRKLKVDGETVKSVAATDALVGSIQEGGVIRTKGDGGAWEQYDAATRGKVGTFMTDVLKREGAEVDPIYVDSYLRKTINNSKLAGNEKRLAMNGIKDEIEGLMLDANPQTGKIPVWKIHESKMIKQAKPNWANPDADLVKKAVARGLKEIVEKNTKTINVDAVNKELAKYEKALKFIEKLDGKRVKGGKLGVYFSQMAGVAIGGVAGFPVGGPMGSALGGAVGSEVAGRLKNRSLMRQFGKETGNIPAIPKILKDASELAKTPKKTPQYKMLPAPRFVAGKPYVGETKMTVLSAKKGAVGRGKNGRFIGTFSSEGTPNVPINKTAAMSWSQFTKGKMGPYMKSEGSHGAAIRRIAREWKEYKSSAQKTRLPIRTKGTESLMGVFAGIEVDENGNTKFNKEKALAGMAGMYLISKGKFAGLSIDDAVAKIKPATYIQKNGKKLVDIADDKLNVAELKAKLIQLSKNNAPQKTIENTAMAITKKISPTEGLVTTSYKRGVIPKSFKQGAVPKTSLPLKSNPLIQEAKRYKTADDFVKAQKPIYHGTDNKFDLFDAAKRGTNEQGQSAKNAFWFSDSKTTAGSYGKNLKEVYTKFDNPITIDAKGKMYGDVRELVDETILKAKKGGNDGVIIKNLSDRKDWGNYEPATHFGVLDTSKIKTKSQLTDIWKKAHKKIINKK